jgi:hypothetical protein
MAGCSVDGLVGSDKLPPDVTDPAATQTREGAVRAYHGTLVEFRRAFDQVLRLGGLLSDELRATSGNFGVPEPDLLAIDSRQLPEDGDFESRQRYSWLYSALHRVRGQARQAIGLLTDYAPDSLSALTGHLYALQAYAEILLAELFCSGIPLSTLDYKGDFTYRPGSTTAQVYEHALALLDTALTLVADSARFANLARLGRARALLGLGLFGAAAAAVAEVPDGFRYGVRLANLLRVVDQQTGQVVRIPYTVGGSAGGSEGVNGLDYGGSGDPRTAVRRVSTDGLGLPIYHPSKYAGDSATVPLASGVEARLIEAEAALRAGDIATWLDKLNHLRRTMWPTIDPPVSEPLPELVDPGTADLRVDLMFRERASWLFLTGHRQGDLRRLIRHYGRTQDQVYPIGSYPGGGQPTTYGSDVDLPVPPEERVSNPLFSRCTARGA